MNADELADLTALTDPLGLWRLLVTVPLGWKLPPAVAIETFRRLHADGAAGAYHSAVLVCTDRRWRNGTAQVIAGITESGLLDEDEQHRLADSLLWQPELEYEHPLWWFSHGFVEIAPDTGISCPARLDPNLPVTARRQIRPPLRTWAAGWMLGRHLASVDDILDCARSLPARDGAAVVSGALRAVGNLDADQAETVLDAALSWRHKTPRKAALQQLLADGKDDLVRDLAGADTDASIRSWAAQQLNADAAPATLFD